MNTVNPIEMPGKIKAAIAELRGLMEDDRAPVYIAAHSLAGKIRLRHLVFLFHGLHHRKYCFVYSTSLYNMAIQTCKG